MNARDSKKSQLCGSNLVRARQNNDFTAGVVSQPLARGPGSRYCYGMWLLKNSFAENSQKKLCDRKPYKRRSPIWWTFTSPQISVVLAKPEFFNSHESLHSSSERSDVK